MKICDAFITIQTEKWRTCTGLVIVIVILKRSFNMFSVDAPTSMSGHEKKIITMRMTGMMMISTILTMILKILMTRGNSCMELSKNAARRRTATRPLGNEHKFFLVMISFHVIPIIIISLVKINDKLQKDVCIWTNIIDYTVHRFFNSVKLTSPGTNNIIWVEFLFQKNWDA